MIVYPCVVVLFLYIYNLFNLMHINIIVFITVAGVALATLVEKESDRKYEIPAGWSKGERALGSQFVVLTLAIKQSNLEQVDVICVNLDYRNSN